MPEKRKAPKGQSSIGLEQFWSVAIEKEKPVARHTMAEVIVGQAARWCGNILAEVQMNYGRFLPEGAKKELHTAVVALAKFDAELMVGIQKAGVRAKR